MLKIALNTGQELKWLQPNALKMQYELRSQDELVASLKFRSTFGTFATAESADGSWTFKRVGFWQKKASTRASGADADLAQFRNNTWSGGGTLEFPDGRRIKATTNLWMTNLEFRTDTDESLVSLKSGGLVHRSARVEISQKAMGNPDIPLLVLLGWWLVIMLDSDMAGAAAAAG